MPLSRLASKRFDSLSPSSPMLLRTAAGTRVVEDAFGEVAGCRQRSCLHGHRLVTCHVIQLTIATTTPLRGSDTSMEELIDSGSRLFGAAKLFRRYALRGCEMGWRYVSCPKHYCESHL